MRRPLLIVILFLSIAPLIFISCDDEPTGEGKSQPLEFAMEPSDGLNSIIQETPSDFTWEYYQDNTRVMGPSQTDFSKFQLVLSSFQIRNGEVVNSTMTDPVEVSAEELSSGLLTEDIRPSLWMPGSDWVSSSDWKPKSTFIQTTDPLVIQTTDPLYPEVEDMVLNNVDLGTDETMVVVYPSIIGESEREMTIQAFGLVMMKKEPTTGTLEAITTTNNGSDNSGYTLLVDGANETTMDPADTTSIGGLDEGSHQAELTNIPSGCEVSGNNPRSVNITAGETTTTTFEVGCEAELTNKIVFHTGRHGSPEIYAMDADGSNKQRLTDNSALDSSPVISNDGSKVAFVSGRNGGQHLFVMNADGSGAQEVTTASTDPGFHSWSPDDSEIVFADYNNGRDIYKVNEDGTGRTQLTSHNADDAFPTWSPDGNKIAFASDRSGNNYEYDIFTMDTDGSNIQQITSGISLNTYAPAPRWSPSGDKLVFATDSGAIMTVEADGNNSELITDDTESDRSPGWSPDGTEIVFERNNDIYKKNADGSGSVTQLTTDADSDIEPFWSPVE